MATRTLVLSTLLLAALLPAAGQARPLVEVHQARVEAAARAHAAAHASYLAGTGPLESIYVWSVRWLNAERAQAGAADGRAAAVARHRARMDGLAAEVAKRVAAGLAGAGDGHAAAYYSAEAELWASEG
jgi:hypothetical protein